MRVHIDFETCSAADLRKTGVYRYVEDKTTRVLCMAYAVDSNDPEVWLPGIEFPKALRGAIEAGARFHAWNAAFERQIWKLARRLYDFPLMLDGRWRCTMIRAAYFGLPMSLDMASRVVGGPQKNEAGHRLMMKMCKPREVDPFGRFIWWDQDPTHGRTMLDELADYCRQDVLAERGIGERIPEMNLREIELWQIDQQINDRGVQVDLALAAKMHALSVKAETKLNVDMYEATGGAVSTTGQIDRLLKWLASQNVHMPDLRSKTIAEALDDESITIDAPPVALSALRIRREAAKSSVKKLNALARATCNDMRVRGMLQFYGAGRTGRWAGRILQPHNLPRPAFKNVRQCIDLIMSGADIIGIEAFFGPVMTALSTCIRGCLIAALGYKLMSVDYAQIEARVLAWLAGQQDILDIYASGKDVYTYDAANIGSKDRQLGKVCRLGLGFGMGPSRFLETALAYGLRLEAQFAESVVRGWRDNNKRIVGYWYEIDKAVKWVLSQYATGQRIAVGKVFIGTRRAVSPRDLIITLPSGRSLVYVNPRLDNDEISYDGMNQMTKKWERIRSWGGKFVENIVQAVARDIMANGLMSVVGVPVVEAYPVLTVHDEIIFETPALEAEATLASVVKLMTCLPAWATNLPLAAEGWVGDRYRK